MTTFLTRCALAALRATPAMADTLARLPERVTVTVPPCDEANAFYDPNDRSIVFCEEFAPFLLDLYDRVTSI